MSGKKEDGIVHTVSVEQVAASLTYHVTPLTLARNVGVLDTR